MYKYIFISIFVLFISVSAYADKYVSIQGKQIEQLAEHPDVEELEIYGISGVNADFHSLKDFEHLNTLNLRGSYVMQPQIDDVAACPHLQSLRVGCRLLEDVSLLPFQEHTQLQSLAIDCGYGHEIHFVFDPVLGWRKVTEFYNYARINEEQLKEIGSIENLRTLEINGLYFDDTINAEAFQEITQIEELFLSYPYFSKANIEELGYVSLPNLTTLKIADLNEEEKKTNVKGLNMGNFAPNLKVLNLENTNAAGNEVKALIAITTLEEVNVSGTSITTGAIKNLSKIPSLRKIEVRDTRIKGADFASFVNLPLLRHLDLSESDITRSDLTGLAQLVQLETLKLNALTSTTIRPEDIENLKEALPNCVIEWEND